MDVPQSGLHGSRAVAELKRLSLRWFRSTSHPGLHGSKAVAELKQPLAVGPVADPERSPRLNSTDAVFWSTKPRKFEGFYG